MYLGSEASEAVKGSWGTVAATSSVGAAGSSVIGAELRPAMHRERLSINSCGKWKLTTYSTKAQSTEPQTTDVSTHQRQPEQCTRRRIELASLLCDQYNGGVVLKQNVCNTAGTLNQ